MWKSLDIEWMMMEEKQTKKRDLSDEHLLQHGSDQTAFSTYMYLKL